LVYPAAGLPDVAKAAGAYVCEVNPEPTPISRLSDEMVAGKAGEVLPLFSV
jgi:NAD-dependent deacetylase